MRGTGPAGGEFFTDDVRAIAAAKSRGAELTIPPTDRPEEMRMNGNVWIRQTHRWVSIVHADRHR